MAVYIFYAYAVDRDAFETTQFADSVYYQGFMFTLVALMVSLYAYAQAAKGTSGEMELVAITSRFGVALMTTLVGLGTRIYLVHFRASGEDSLEKAEKSLSRAAQNLRVHLNQLSIDTVAQNAALNKSLREAIDTSASALSGAINTSSVTLTKATERLGEDVGSASRGLSEEIADIVKSARSLKESIEIPQKIIADKLAPVSSEAERWPRRCGNWPMKRQRSTLFKTGAQH